MTIKLLSNYPAKFAGDGKVGVPVRLQIANDLNYLKVEVWESDDAFQNDLGSLPGWTEEFSFNEISGASIEQMKSAALAWLNRSAEFYEIENLDINLTTLSISATARSKVRPNKTVSDTTLSAEEFEEIKGQYPNLVVGFAVTAWTYALTHSEKLQGFE